MWNLKKKNKKKGKNLNEKNTFVPKKLFQRREGKTSARIYPATNHCLKLARHWYSLDAEGKSNSTGDPSLPKAVSYIVPFLQIWDNHFVLEESRGCALGEFGFKILGFDPVQKNKSWAPAKHLKSALARGWPLYLPSDSRVASTR